MTLHEAQKTVNFIFLNYSEYDFASLITYQIASPHKPKKKKKIVQKVLMSNSATSPTPAHTKPF